MARAPFKARPLMTDALKEFRKMKREDVAYIITQMLRKTSAETSEIQDDTRSNMLERMIASIMRRVEEKGDPHGLEFLLERTIGKVVQRYEHDESLVERLEQAEKLKAMPQDQLLALVQRAISSHNKSQEEANSERTEAEPADPTC